MAAQFIYPPNEPVIFLSREFDAPRALVWEAMTSSALLTRWWRPRRHTTIMSALDVRAGGKWRIVNAGADGALFEFFGEYLEVAPPEQLTMTFGFADFPPVTERYMLEDIGARTRLEALMCFESVAARDAMAASGAESGAIESYERLDDLLAGFAPEFA